MMKTRRPDRTAQPARTHPYCTKYKPCPVCKACNCRISANSHLVVCWACFTWLVSVNDVLRLMTDAEKDALTVEEQATMEEITAYCKWNRERGYGFDDA